MLDLATPKPDLSTSNLSTKIPIPPSAAKLNPKEHGAYAILGIPIVTALPMLAMSWYLMIDPPPAKQLKRVGWTLVVGTIASAIWMIFLVEDYWWKIPCGNIQPTIFYHSSPTPILKPSTMLDLLDADFTGDPKPQLLLQKDSFKVMRLVLPAGKTIREHKAPKEITVQTVSDAVDFTAKGEMHRMTTGKLLNLEPGELHALTAIEASVMLVTMAK